MKVSGIDYGLLPSWEIEVPDSAIVVENTTPERIPPALEDPAKAVLEAIRNPRVADGLQHRLGRVLQRRRDPLRSGVLHHDRRVRHLDFPGGQQPVVDPAYLHPRSHSPLDAGDQSRRSPAVLTR